MLQFKKKDSGDSSGICLEKKKINLLVNTHIMIKNISGRLLNWFEFTFLITF